MSLPAVSPSLAAGVCPCSATSAAATAAFPPGIVVDLGGVRMHCVDVGPRDVPPVVMLHGNPTWSFYYRRLIAALSERFRCIVPDHIGMGLSDKPSDDRYDYTLTRRIADLEELLEQLAVDRNVTLVVHDWGGMIGCGWAVRHPESVAALVVLNTAAFHLPHGKRLLWPLRLCRVPMLGDLLVRGLNLFVRGTLRNCVARPLAADVRREYLRPYGNRHDRRAVLRFIQDIPLRPGDRSYADVSLVESNLHTLAHVPTWIGWGLRDFVFDRDFLDQWTQRFPQAEVHAFADAGHLVLEDAADDVIPRIRQFLAQHLLQPAGNTLAVSR